MKYVFNFFVDKFSDKFILSMNSLIKEVWGLGGETKNINLNIILF
jgi:hypothetical protein